MNDKLTPPAGSKSWLDWAVETMETRDLFNDVHLVDDGQENRHGWPRHTQREDMRASARRELEELRQLAVLGKTHLAIGKLPATGRRD